MTLQPRWNNRVRRRRNGIAVFSSGYGENESSVRNYARQSRSPWNFIRIIVLLFVPVFS